MSPASPYASTSTRWLPSLRPCYERFCSSPFISQEKWLWFQRPCPLRHLEDFDFGSRGIWGSAKLLLVAYTSAVPFIAAVTTIILLTTGSLTQQAVKTTLCRQIVDIPAAAANQDRALIPVAAKLSNKEIVTGYVGEIVAVSPETMNGIQAGLTNPDLVSTSAFPFSCPTGNCTFAESGGITYSTLERCPSTEYVSGYDDYGTCKSRFAPPDAADVEIW
ncbi:hypothetical protein B0T24DRAFT_685729 [Lasiosphaeria ovina]|uniref:Uncharacterized protein n=1 Tax=Lasiosphaeria ovina TaxID=92902 RepID=A0AAE0NIA0_9PEZI|nr:hypothetical protein B0T24DRAFT_685729 [Lasiosphaeria ovina]